MKDSDCGSPSLQRFRLCEYSERPTFAFKPAVEDISYGFAYDPFKNLLRILDPSSAPADSVLPSGLLHTGGTKNV